MNPPSRTFEFMLNAMENAAAAENPAHVGYAEKRKAVLEYVAKLEVVFETVKLIAGGRLP